MTTLARAATIAFFLPAFTFTGTAPADAARASITIASTPKAHPLGVYASGRTFTLGTSGNPIRTEVQIRVLLGGEWIYLSPRQSGAGEKTAWAVVRNLPGRQQYQARARNVVTEVVGGDRVVRRGKWDVSQVVTL